MAVAIVCATIAAQAGSVKWTLADVTDPAEGYAYLFNSADVAYAGIDTILASITDGTFALTYAANAANEIDFEESIAFAKAIDGISGSTTLWMVAVDDATDPTMAFVGEELTITIGSSGSKTYTWTYADNTTSWQSVPEPTSGLLILIGMAGLALKRKRA